MFILVDYEKHKFFHLSKEEALALEVKINVTKYSEQWKSLADKLYNYGISYSFNDVTEIVNNHDFELLKILLHMSYIDVQEYGI